MNAQTAAQNTYWFARELHHRFKGTSRIEEQLFELTTPLPFDWTGQHSVAFPYLAVWQFPDYPGDGQPATQLVGFVHDPRDTSVQHSAFILETWTDLPTTAEDALLNAEIFGQKGGGYKIW